MNKCIFSLSLNRVCGFLKKINMKKVSPVLTNNQSNKNPHSCKGAHVKFRKRTRTVRRMFTSKFIN